MTVVLSQEGEMAKPSLTHQTQAPAPVLGNAVPLRQAKRHSLNHSSLIVKCWITSFGSTLLVTSSSSLTMLSTSVSVMGPRPHAHLPPSCSSTSVHFLQFASISLSGSTLEKPIKTIHIPQTTTGGCFLTNWTCHDIPHPHQ